MTIVGCEKSQKRNNQGAGASKIVELDSRLDVTGGDPSRHRKCGMEVLLLGCRKSGSRHYQTSCNNDNYMPGLVLSSLFDLSH